VEWVATVVAYRGITIVEPPSHREGLHIPSLELLEPGLWSHRAHDLLGAAFKSRVDLGMTEPRFQFLVDGVENCGQFAFANARELR